MSLLSQLTPENLLEEKARFFSDFSYQPQFIYKIPTEQHLLAKYGTPKKELLAIAQEIVSRAFHTTTDTELYEAEGVELSQAEVEEKTRLFLSMHNLEHRFSIVWSSSFLVRTSIDSDTIKLRLPAAFRQNDLLGMLYHEIGTHALRRINYEQQPWYKKKKKFGFSEYLITEEGLASLHSLLPQNNKLAYNIALRYLAVEFAQHNSFAELWKFLTPYVDDLDRRWIIATRQKRGITDTSQPGGFTKDMVYFDGLVEVGRWLQNNAYDPTPLYFGKVALEDVGKAIELAPNFKPLMPSFYSLDQNEYASQIKAILDCNGFLL